MVNGWSIPPLLMASINAYVAVHYLVIYLRTRRSRQPLSFAHATFAVCLYDIACALLYGAASPEAGRTWQLAQSVAITYGVMALLVFVADYARRPVARFVLGMGIVYGLLLAWVIVGGTGLVFTDVPSVKHLELTFGLGVTYNEVAAGPVDVLHEFVSLGIFVYGFVAGAGLFRAGERRRAVRLLGVFGLMFVSALNDIGVGLGFLRSIYTLEYAFMGIVILMADSLSHELVEAARTEEALRQSEQRYREVFNATSEAIFLHDGTTGAVLDVNDTVFDLYGYTREEALKLGAADLSAGRPPFTETEVRARIRRALAEGPQVFEWLGRRKSGEEFWVEVALRGSLIGGEGRVLAVVRDISERKEAEEELRLSEEHFRSMVQQSSDVITVHDAHGAILYESPSADRVLGYGPDGLVGRDPFELVHPDDLRLVREAFEKTYRRQNPGIPTGYRMRHAKGHWVHLETLGRNLLDHPAVRGIVLTSRDITERTRAEAALRLSEERFKRLAEAAFEGIGITDGGRVLDVNTRLAEMLGYQPSEMIGREVMSFVAPESAEQVEAFIREGKDEPYEHLAIRKDGSIFPVETQGKALETESGTMRVAAVRDITERKRAEEERQALEEQLRQAQKMEAVGRLAGGVAHDFNNLLQAILSHADSLAARASTDPGGVAAGLAELRGHATRGASLTRQLLLFSRQEATRFESLDLSQVVYDAANLVRRLLRENIEFRLIQVSQPLPIQGDHGQLEQVVMNLALNAAYAMQDGGTLTVETGSGPGERVWLEVRDTGHGIPDAIRSRIFDPFFTTKPSSEGSGLGLSVVHGIVARHGGEIEVTTEVGSGSAFRVVLPRSSAATSPGGVHRSQDFSTLARGHGERVLVVEDEQGARDALARIIAMLGFEVATAAGVVEARRLAAAGEFDLLLTDHVLPDGVGQQLAEELQRSHPSLAVVLMSGYTQDEHLRRTVGSGRVRFLQKPFGMATLAAELAAALGDRHPHRRPT